MTETAFTHNDMTPATKEETFGLFAHLEEALEARGYFRPADKKPKMVDNLRALLIRRGLFSQEIHVLRGVVNSLDRFSRTRPKGAGAPEDEPAAPGEGRAND